MLVAEQTAIRINGLPAEIMEGIARLVHVAESSR